jgi:hypothetical protein
MQKQMQRMKIPRMVKELKFKKMNLWGTQNMTVQPVAGRHQERNKLARNKNEKTMGKNINLRSHLLTC